MARVSFHASFWTGDAAIVEQLLSAWLSVDDFHMWARHRREVHYETPELELFCYETMEPRALKSFLLEGHIDGSVDDAVSRLRALSDRCESLGVNFDGEYEEVDEDGNQLSREQNI